MKSALKMAVAVAALAAGVAQAQETIRQNPGFQSRIVPRNDDGSSPLEPLGFTINFFGKLRSAAYVNNNGNLTFDQDLSTFTPFGLLNTASEIIAPFFADVDTRPDGSNVVTYGQDLVNGHRAFGANYINVGYYANHVDKLNSFQVVLIEREDIGPGDFDIEFNYERIVWETGDASEGVDGFGGTPAAVGWSNGADVAFELPGSRIPGSFLDGGPHALVSQSISGRTYNVPGQPQTGREGRLIFRARDGQISPGIVISGGLFPDATLGTPYSATLSVQGADPPYTWTLQPDIAPPAGLSLSTAGVLSGTPTAAGTYSFTLGVTAQTEDGEVTVYERGSLTVRPPALQVTSSCPLPDGYVGVPYSFNLTASGSPTGYTWTILEPATVPPGMGLTPAGLFAGTPLYPGTYILNAEVAATNNPDAKPVKLLCRMNVAPARLQLTAANCALPRATVGVPYEVLLDGQGGEPPYRFELIHSLPQGVALTSDGVLAGTPGMWGVWPFKIATIDARGSRTVQDCALSVDVARFATSACPLPSGTTGEPYSTNLPGGYTWTVLGALPQGLQLGANGSIAGTPMVAGPHHFSLLATTASGDRSAEACSLTVARGDLNVTGCPLPDGRVGEPYTAALLAGGGASPYIWASMGPMPAGLSLSTLGAVTGTPNRSGEFPFSVMLRDANFGSRVQACRITVHPAALRFTNACPLPDAAAGAQYSARVEVAGGVSPYEFAIAGFLPDGLQLNADGSITGVPQRQGGRSFTIYAFDAAGTVVPRDCSIAVVAARAPAISLGNLPPTAAPAQTNFSIPIQIAEPFAHAVTGKVNLAVTPNTSAADATANSADPRLGFANGQKTAGFTIPAGGTSASVPLASTGTVASTVIVSLSDLRAAGAPLAQYPAAKTFQIPAAVPSVTSACYAPTETGVEFRVAGITTTRELKRAVVSIPGITITRHPIPPVPDEFVIQNRDTAVIDLANLSEAFFATPLNVRTGGAFSLTFSLDFDAAPGTPIDNVSFDIFNSAGGAGSRQIQRCQ